MPDSPLGQSGVRKRSSMFFVSDVTAARKRSSMFFVSDVTAAAETAAFSLEEYGLTDDQVMELAERLENAILDYFSEVRDA